jgi:hypothetical protein
MYGQSEQADLETLRAWSHEDPFPCQTILAAYEVWVYRAIFESIVKDYNLQTILYPSQLPPP